MAMSSPPPQRSRHSPTALVDDAMFEIFLRVPPDDPKSLVRAAAVCPSWRGILSDAAFAREHRAFHGAPPMLGFLHKKIYTDYANYRRRREYCISHFVSTASSCPRACEGRQDWHVLDSRHGLVLYYTPEDSWDLAICDLVSYPRRQWRINADSSFSHIIRWNEPKDNYRHKRVDEYGWSSSSSEEEEEEDKGPDEGLSWNATVLCAKGGCDHLDCHDSPFLVAFVASNESQGRTLASVYSSETSEWSDMISIAQRHAIDAMGHTAVVGNKVYFPCKQSNRIIEYNVGERALSVINAPFHSRLKVADFVLMGAEDGMLLFATVHKLTLCLCSMDTAPNRAPGWARKRVIKLSPLLPHRALSGVSVVGFAEGAGVIFLNTWHDGLFTIELSSGRSKKIHGEGSRKVVPYMSFYTGGYGWHSGGAPHAAQPLRMRLKTLPPKGWIYG